MKRITLADAIRVMWEHPDDRRQPRTPPEPEVLAALRLAQEALTAVDRAYVNGGRITCALVRKTRRAAAACDEQINGIQAEREDTP